MNSEYQKTIDECLHFWPSGSYAYWISLTRHYYFCDEFVEQYISEYGPIKDTAFWQLASSSSRISFNFIRKYQHDVAWGAVSSYSNLSIEFVDEFHDKIDVERLLRNTHCHEEFKKIFE